MIHQAYQEVNEEFALKTLDALREVHRNLREEKNGEMEMKIDTNPAVPVVWIHDYQLMLAAAMIRQVLVVVGLMHLTFS